MENTFLLYGANGYTGELIARFAADYNLQPILAGRREAVIKPLAEKLNYPYRIFDLNDSTALLYALKEVKVVINAAGPFQYTAKQMIESCLQTGTHYLDINGDISVFEFIRSYDEAAKKKNIMLLPGAGFDVVPTDCTALLLKKKLPDAVSLKLAFATLGGGLSHGTASTMVSKLGEGGASRKNGKIVREPLGKNGMVIDFGLKKIFVMSIPWGDVATAYYTTDIPDIESYTGMPKSAYYLLKAQSAFNWLLRTSFFRKILKKRIEKRPAGPNDEQRKKALSLIWGQATNAAGRKATVRMQSPDGYTLSMYACLIITQKIMQGKFVTGFHTPATAYGEDLVLEIPGVKREEVKIDDSP